jgi:hypothetical protein
MGLQERIDWEAARDAGKAAAVASIIFGNANPDGVDPAQFTGWERIGRAALQNATNQLVQSALTQLVEDRHIDWTEAARAGVIGGVTGGLVEGISIAASAESLSAFNRRQNDPVGRHDNLLQNGFNSFVNSALSAKVGDALQ